MAGSDFYKTRIDQMVKQALAEKEAAFAESHRNDSDNDLLQYYFDCAKELKHTPRSREFVGWTLLQERFGSIEAVAKRLGFQPYQGNEPVSEYALVAEEYSIQKKIYRQRKQEKRRKKELRKQMNEKRRRQEDAWLAEHAPEKLARKKRKASRKKAGTHIKPPEK